MPPLPLQNNLFILSGEVFDGVVLLQQPRCDAVSAGEPIRKPVAPSSGPRKPHSMRSPCGLRITATLTKNQPRHPVS
jgi:hypothetical protein